MKFKKGDKVRVIKEWKPGEGSRKNLNGRVGTFVSYTRRKHYPYDVKFKGRIPEGYDHNDEIIVHSIKKVGGDDLTKKKADGKRIALGQKHERDYLLRKCKEMLDFNKGKSRIYAPLQGVTIQTMRRICKALIKALRKYK